MEDDFMDDSIGILLDAKEVAAMMECFKVGMLKALMGKD